MTTISPQVFEVWASGVTTPSSSRRRWSTRLSSDTSTFQTSVGPVQTWELWEMPNNDMDHGLWAMWWDPFLLGEVLMVCELETQLWSTTCNADWVEIMWTKCPVFVMVSIHEMLTLTLPWNSHSKNRKNINGGSWLLLNDLCILCT